MPIRIARKVALKLRLLREGYGVVLGALLVLLGCESLQNAVAEGDTRTISLHHLHTGEDLTITYKRNGRYDDAALEKLNWELRDWRRSQSTQMDPRLIDLVWEVQRDLGSAQPIQIVCGYRAPETNAMLRRRSSGVAQFSQHTLGKAMDFYLLGVPLEKLREAGMRLQRGGVGFYPTSGSPFVHLDVGGIRMWPRMSREMLARVFPDGRTVYLPTDGKPLAGYALALADVQRHGSAPSQITLASARDSGAVSGDAVAQRNIFSKLFGSQSKAKDADDDDADEPAPILRAAPPAPRPTTVAAADVDKAAAVPLPRSKPDTLSYQVASADAAAPVGPLPQSTVVLPQAAPVAPAPVAPAPRPAQAASLVHVASASANGGASANQVIGDRGYWQGLPADADPAPAARAHLASAAAAVLKRAVTVRRAFADTGSPEAETTASLGSAGTSRVPTNLALAYAALPHDDDGITAATRPSAAPAPQISAAPAADTTVAVKKVGTPVGPAALREAVRSGERFDDPWLRSMIVVADVRNSLTTTPVGGTDYRTLTPMMQKPRSVVVMSFSTDPQQGLADTRLSGNAVGYLATVTFGARTASLQ